MLLINWHYIKYQVIDFADINFLTGKNGAGKSTIIDALQLVLLGDTSGYYFNKAANDKSQRTLKGYLRGEVAEDAETNTIYLRNDDFSSYIVLEFFDQEKDEHFCLGVVFDCYRDGSHEHRFFYLNSRLPDNHFIVNGVELNRDNLRAFLLNNYPKGKYEFFETNSRYKDVLLGKLGHIKQKFFSLFKKAVPFSPIMDIKGFISEFVCDVENKIDITDMQETIRNYKQLEQELEVVKGKLAALTELDELYSLYFKEKERLEIQSYLVERAEEEKLQNRIINLMQEITGLKDEVAAITRQIELKELEIGLKAKERDNLYREKVESDLYKKRSQLEEKIEALKQEIKRVKDLEDGLKRFVYSSYTVWQEIAEWLNNNLSEIPSINKEITLFKNIYQGQYELVTEDRLQNTKENLQALVNTINEKYSEYKNESAELGEENARLTLEITNLKKGIKSYPPALQELKKLIAEKLTEKYQKKIEPAIFADLIEIKNAKWQNAIEGYLHTQKFYLIIEPQYFLDALKVYDDYKFTHNIYDIGLVDIEKVMALEPKIQAESLAQEIESEDPLARAYADYLLGQVIKCENVKDLRKFKTAITPTCMLYHNYVARQLNPKRYEFPYIGRQAIVEQLKRKEELLTLNTARWQEVEVLVKKLAGLRNISILNDENIKNMLAEQRDILNLPRLNEELSKKTLELGQLDLSYLTKLDNIINQVEQEIGLLNKQIKELSSAKGRKESEMITKEESLPGIKTLIQDKQDYIKSRYPREWVEETGEPRFQKELSERKDAQNIIASFSIAAKRTQSIMGDRWRELLDKRVDYNRQYHGIFNVQLENNEPYRQELKKLKETLLVEYEEKIKDAQEKAQIQFKEDFISKLKSNIEAAKEQIDDLNKALKDVPFGRDKYKFKVTPNPYYKKYYDMITDDMLLEGLTLFSHSFQQKYKDVTEELFRQIVDTDEGLLTADKREELNKNLEKYTDYRTYLDFDLIVTDDTGNESRLSRVISKKSGGETQTPFYISVLASFVQLYRVNQRENCTARLIVFDEAYSKMDHQRIKESINLIRNMGLQVILSAPTEKIGDIAPLVDRNLCVTRIKNETIVKAFDPRELEDMGA